MIPFSTIQKHLDFGTGHYKCLECGCEGIVEAEEVKL